MHKYLNLSKAFNSIKKSSIPTFMVVLTIAMTLVISVSSFSYGIVPLNNDKPAIHVTARKPTFNSSNFGRLNGTFIPVPKDAFFALVIGNDYRPGVEGKRADGVHLVGVNTAQNKVTILNFPRDTTVSIPGYGRNKINAANAFGGSELTTRTVEELTGVSVSYVLEADFAAFVNLVNDLGGIDVPVEKPMKDKNSGTNFDPGIVRMDGGQALAFARDRYSFSNGDLQRSQNHGIILIAALAEMQKSKTTISSRFESAALIAKHLQLTNLSIRDLFFLMEQANKIDSTTVNNVLVPWAGSNTLAPKSNDLFADFRDNAILDTYQ